MPTTFLQNSECLSVTLKISFDAENLYNEDAIIVPVPPKLSVLI